MIKELIPEENITSVTIYTSNIRAPKYIITNKTEGINI